MLYSNKYLSPSFSSLDAEIRVYHIRLVLEINKKKSPIRAKGTVADLNVYLMKMRFDWTKVTRS